MEKGQKMSLEQKLKISESKKGQIPWNKGKIGLQKHSEETKKKLSLFNIGKIKELETRQKMSKRMLGYKPKLETRNKISKSLTGTHRSEEIKQKISQTMKGKKPYQITDEIRQKMSQSQINSPNKIFKNTSIELKIEVELKRKNIKYIKQFGISGIGIVDFYLPDSNTIIECDGDYWHSRPKTKERDEIKNKLFIDARYNLYRFWEHEINKSPEECINQIKFR